MYQIEKYKPENRAGVTELLTDLWGDSAKENEKQFAAKYEKNPYDNQIYAIITLHEGKVVGFRGFIPSKWKIFGEASYFLLVADANVHSEHRRRGLFQKMNQKALEIFQDSKFEGYLNLTSNRFSSPGYLKLGWKKIHKADYHRFTNLKSLILWKLNVPPKPKNTNKDVQIINSLKNNQIKSLIALEEVHNDKITIYNKEKLYKYKLLRNNYQCFVYKENNILKAYATITINDGVCSIVDFEYQSKVFLMKLICEIKKSFHVVSMWNIISKNENLKKSLLSKYMERAEKKDKTDLLYRPIKLKLTSDSFHLNGVNMLDPKVWNLKQICEE